MRFQKGQPPPAGAGRPKGSKDKKKMTKIVDYLIREGLNPAEELIRLVETTDEQGDYILTAKDRANIWMELLSYCESKPKATEVSALDESDETMDLLEDLSDDELVAVAKGEAKLTIALVES
jgi:hypothetical protein